MHQPNNSNYFIIILLFPISLFLVLVGVKGLIENLSPTELDKVVELSQAFIVHFEYHALIIAGAMFLDL